jgi:hypothetical protein
MSVYAEPNTNSREDLGTLVRHLTEEDLARPLEAGWTVAAVLAHLAFWDARALTLIRKWKVEGIGPSPIDVDAVNEAARCLCLAIPPAAAAELVFEQAREIDAEIEGLEGSFLAEMADRGQTVRLDRAAHRQDHLRQIEAALGRGSRP